MKTKGSGVLLHITSLPSSHGIGDLGPWAYRFADFLTGNRQKFWQVLPLSPTIPIQGNSPYSSTSAYACNPLLVSPELMIKDGFLRNAEVHPNRSSDSHRIDYDSVIEYKRSLLDLGYRRFKEIGNRHEYDGFCFHNSHWLENYALFASLKLHFEGAVWSDWPEEIRDRDQGTLDRMRNDLREEMERHKFCQFLVYKQWFALKRYCNDRGIKIIGDVPIYVSYDSADAWSNSEIFKLDDRKKPTFVAGVPPDYFSKTGQLWGNPVYDWQVCESTGFKWWLRRMEHILSLFDVVRIDHLRGLVAYWEVPAGERTAISGKWVEVPSRSFFDTMLRRFADFPIIAEDLGLITEDVRKVMMHYGFPGMKVLLFAFSENNAGHPYLPHNYEENCAVYTGTHDNNTVRGWFESEARGEDRKRFFKYIGRQVPIEDVHWEFIRLAIASPARMAIFPMQDILGLGEDARMNRPAVLEGNWEWRLLPEQLTSDIADRLFRMTQESGRA
jgi:4-alpha-glucanotransferase